MKKHKIIKRKNGSSIKLKDKNYHQYKPIVIIIGIVCGLFFIALQTWKYLRVLSAGESCGYATITYFNRHGELYIDGFVIFLALGLCLSALILYLKDFKEEYLHE